MELRAYWAVVWRWRWLALAAALATFVASLAVQTREPTLYTAVLRLAVRPEIEMVAGGTDPAREQYYEYTTAEFLNDDIMDVVKSPTFGNAAAQRAGAALGRPVYASIDAKKAHKLIMFSVTADAPQEAEAMAKAIAELLADPRAGYFQRFVSFGTTVTMVDDVVVGQSAAPSRTYLYMMLRVVLGLVAGLGLAFFLEYLDDTVRTPAELERATGLAVLGEIPAGRGRRGQGSGVQAGPRGRAQTA